MGIADSLMSFLYSLEGLPAYALLFGLLLGSGFGLPINEDILLLGAAALTLKGVMDPIPLVAVAWSGILAADTLIFHWGHQFGARLLRHRLFARLMPPRRLQSMRAAMLRYGPGYIFLARFMPGVRSALYFAAGSLKLPYRHQIVFDGAAALVELPLLVWGVRYVGGRWNEIMAIVEQFQSFLVPGILLLVLGVWLIRAVR
jgi:membrane protein DedA with SNARE-associated domain